LIKCKPQGAFVLLAFLAFPLPAGATDRALQLRLTQEGFYTGPIDGMFGPASRRALSEYASDRGIADDIDETIPRLFEEARAWREDVTEGQRKAAGEALNDELRDAESARVRFDFTYPMEGIALAEPAIGHRVVCGEVNARNAFNAYTGFQPFNVLLVDYGGDRYIRSVTTFGESAQATCYLGTHFAIGVTPQ